MSNQVIKGSVRYTEESVHILDQVITDNYHVYKRVLMLLALLACIVYGVSVGINTTTGFLFTMIGCLLLPLWRKSNSLTCSRIARILHNKVLSMEYRFDHENVTCSIRGSTSVVPYHDLIRLVETDQYYFLFQNRNKAIMVERNSIQPGQDSRLRTLLERGSGLTFTRNDPEQRIRERVRMLFKKVINQITAATR